MNISFYSSQIDSTSLYSASITKIIKTTGSDAGIYSLSIANKYGCKAFAATAVSIRLKPTANFTLSSLSCEKRTTAFLDLSSGHAPLNSWYWDFGDSSTGNELNPNHIFNGSKIYSVREVVKDANGCISDTAIYGIQVNALPDVDFVLPKICLADPFASFINLSTISDDTENSFTYSWNFDDAISGNLNTSVDKDPKHKYSATGNYNVHLAVTSKDGCKNDSTKLFTVNGVKPKALFNIDNSGVLCSKDSIGISNASTVDFGSIVKVEIYWDYGNDPLNKLTDTLPFNNKVYNNNYFSQTNQSSKDFIIHYIAYSGISCMNQISKTVTIQRSPVVQFGPVPSVCEEVAPFLITEAIETTGTSGAPSFTGDGMNKNGLFNPSAASKGLHSIHYTYTTNAGCSASTEQNILVYPKPAVNAGPDRVAIKGTYITLHASASGNNLTYSWIPAASIDNPAILDPGVSPTSDITYTLTATSSDGCSNQDNVFITVTNRLYIPTAFTPNGDGLNDVWKLPSLESYPNAQAWIYDRWGNLIFHSSGATVSWDGSFNGKPQPAGSYIYLIDLKNSTPILKGTITLIR
jgi:gliding motility-associated-like protein